MFGKKAKLSVSGMSCGHCEQSVEKSLMEMEPVSKVKADHGKDMVTVHYKGDSPSLDETILRVKNLGYEPGDAWV
jgi:copper chaperone